MAVPFKVTISAIGECNPSGIVIGRVGEHDVIQVLFDFSAWQEEIGAGIPNLIFQRHGDTNPYPIVLSIDGTIATWTVSLTDTSVAGLGRAEIQYISVDDGAFLGKSATMSVNIINTMQPAGDAPDPYESWIDTLTELASETEANAQAAAGSAENAEQSAENAEAWAVGKRNGQDVPSTDETYHNNSKHYAGEAHTEAGLAHSWQIEADRFATDAYNAKVAAEAAKGDAIQAKADAIQAKNDAVSAKNNAVSAKNDAVQAKADAQSARDLAQGYASNAHDSEVNAAASAAQAQETVSNATFLQFEVDLTTGTLYIIKTNADNFDFELDQTDGVLYFVAED